MKIELKRGLILNGAELLEPTTAYLGKEKVRAWICRLSHNEIKIITESNLRTRKGNRTSPLMAGCNRIYANYKSRCRTRNVFFELTREEFHSLVTKPCTYCGCDPMGRETVSGFRYNGLDRKKNDKGYVKGNVVPACGPCNSIKSDKLTHAEMMAGMEAILRVRKRKRR